MATRIYVMTHKSFTPPDDTAYHPLHVGRASGTDLGFQGDDTGDNISAKNNRYGELTGFYWIWKNSDFQGNVGVCHYRRVFMGEDGRLLREKNYDEILEKWDVITTKAMESPKPYREYYLEAHNPQELRLLRDAVEELFPEDLNVYDETMEERFYYFGNLCVMKRDEFNAYCEWLFALMGYVEERIDLSGYDEYHGRVYGFLSEQLLRTWTKKRGLTVYECPAAMLGEKAETTEFKLAMKQLFKQGMIEEADKLFWDILKVRPDIGQQSADLSGEIPVIEKLIYLSIYEKKNKIKGLMSYSNDLTVLIDHYRKTTAIIKKKAFDEADAAYLKKTNVSEPMKEFIRKNE